MMQQTATFNWASAAMNALSAFESPQNGVQQPPPITFPPSAYAPTFMQAQFMSFGALPNDPRAALNVNQGDPSMVPQSMDGMGNERSPWGGFALTQGFTSSEGYAGPSMYSAEDAAYQYIKLPSRHMLPIVPIYETVSPVSVAPTDILSASNLYPQPAMPLTIKHPEFVQRQQSAGASVDWTTAVMDDIARLETMAYQQSSAQSRPPLTISSQSDLHSLQQAQMQQAHMHLLKEEEKILKLEDVQETSVEDIYEATAFLHDHIAEDRLNSGAKEIVSLPSGLPAIPSLSVRTPAPRMVHAHPYSSPRLGPVGSPRLVTGSLERRGSRSIRPIVRNKREPMPAPGSITTAYLAGLRRPMPSSVLERTPEDPYPRSQGILYPLSIDAALAGNSNIPAGPNSASTSTTSLPPPESPFSSSQSLMTGILESPDARRGSIAGAPSSPTKEFTVTMNEEGSLRLNRGSSVSRQSRGSPGSSTDRPQTQTRATASRKRADDDLISVSFRGDDDWRRRAVLENVLAAQFLADNVMEPNNTGAGDPFTMGMGQEGKSIYAVFLEQVERSQWRCLFGDKEHPCSSHAISFKRLERALDHVRSHLNHRPFICKGECQKGDSCDARFFARSHLQDHVKRTESACCETCGQVIRIQNMPRHKLAH